MEVWKNEAGDELRLPDGWTVLECTTLHDEHRVFVLGSQEWIPCTERLPAERTEVLAFDAEHGHCIAAWQREVNYAHHCDGWFDSVEGMPLKSVTHWQPLPARPKEPADPAAGG